MIIILQDWAIIILYISLGNEERFDIIKIQINHYSCSSILALLSVMGCVYQPQARASSCYALRSAEAVALGLQQLLLFINLRRICVIVSKMFSVSSATHLALEYGGTARKRLVESNIISYFSNLSAIFALPPLSPWKSLTSWSFTLPFA